MANALYDKAREGFTNAAINWGSDTIKVALFTTGYTFSQAHQYYSDITGATLLAVATLASKTNTGGTLDAADVTFSAVSGANGLYLVIYKDTGTTTTSPLIHFIDTATGLPVTPNGGNILVTWDNGTFKIVKI